MRSAREIGDKWTFQSDWGNHGDGNRQVFITHCLEFYPIKNSTVRQRYGNGYRIVFNYPNITSAKG